VFYVLSLILLAEITTGVINDCGFIITCAEVRQSSINKLFKPERDYLYLIVLHIIFVPSFNFFVIPLKHLFNFLSK
jgi:hypothetical protein